MPNTIKARNTPRNAPRLGKRPERIAQEAFDRNAKHLHRLAGLLSGERARADDLYYYAHDLLYTEIQTALLRHLLPFCLEAWRDDLHGQGGYGGFVEQFYPVLANKQVFSRHLTSAQTAAVSEFMRETILDEIDGQRGLQHAGSHAVPYRWFTAMATYGVLLPDIEALWVAWWSAETIGRAVAALQYVSCLMYPDDANPVFSPWTRDRGGGPPSLWEFGGFLYTNRWLDPNVAFLVRALTPSAVEDLVNRAVMLLADQPEHEVAVRIRRDLPSCAQRLADRCVELPLLLGTVQKPDELLEWSS